MPRVLITSARAPVALELARQFKSAGYDVFTTDSMSARLCSWSRSVTAHLQTPGARLASRAYIQSIAQFVQRNAIDFIVPTCEEIFYLSAYREHLPDSLYVFADNFELLRCLHSKLQFVELARHHGMPVPDTISLTSLDALNRWRDGRSCVLKPEFSRFGDRVVFGDDFSPEQIKGLHGYLAQERLRGQEFCSYSIARQGQISAHVIYRPAYRWRESASFVFEAVEVPSISHAVKEFISKIKFTGQIAFDWIQQADGQCVALECNPRATSGVHLLAGVPSAMIGPPGSAVESRPGAMAMMSPLMLSCGLYDAIQSGQIGAWSRDFSRAREVVAQLRDPMPLMGALLDLVQIGRVAQRQNCSVRAASSFDMEYNGRELTDRVISSGP